MTTWGIWADKRGYKMREPDSGEKGRWTDLKADLTSEEVLAPCVRNHKGSRVELFSPSL